MTRTTNLTAAAALILSAPAAFAQTAVVTPDGTVVAQPVVPGVITGASGGTPAGTNATPGTAFPRSAETTGNSGLLGGQTAEQHEKFGN